MLKKFLPKEENFFKYLQEIAANVLEAAQQLSAMTNNVQNLDTYVSVIEKIEQKADKTARITFELLDKTFITPFDRQDIHKLTSYLDDTLDSVNLTAHYLAIYKLSAIPEPIRELAKIVEHCASIILQLVEKLKSLENSAGILAACDALNQADDEAQRITLAGIEALFAEEEDIKRLLKVKEIYGYATSIVERCQHIANIIRRIVLEYA